MSTGQRKPFGFPKPSATKRKKEKKNLTIQRTNHERVAKGGARKRDRFRCRFPLCGCQKLGLALEARLEVSHEQHKGMGGNPSGSRSTTAGLVTLCKHRHQDGRISRHKGTLRAKLGPLGYDGPVSWQVDMAAIGDMGASSANWKTVAKETAPGVLGPLTATQRTTLELLGEMEL